MAIAIEVLSDSKKAQKDIADLRRSVDGIKDSASKAADSIKGVISSITAMAVSAITLSSFVKLNDEIVQLNTKIKLASNSNEEFIASLSSVKKIAIDTRQSLSSVSTLYNKIAISSKAFGASQNDMATFTSNVAKAIAASGAGAVQAEAAIMQLGQALASGKLQGDELRSISENAPELYRQIALGMNKTIGQMRTLGEQGKLTSEEIFKALINQSALIDKNFSNIGVTYGQAFQNVSNAFVILADGFTNGLKTVSEGTGAVSKTIPQRINEIAVSIANFGKNLNYEFNQIEFIVLRFMRNFDYAISAYESFKNKLSGNSFKFNIDFKEISLEKFIPKLDPMLDKIKSWTFQAERAFFWLYDRVIGHSWIPDLVTESENWLKRLVKNGSSLVSDFVKKSNTAFSKLNETGLAHTFKQVFGMHDKYPGTYENPEGGLYAIDNAPTAQVGRGPKRSSESRPFLHDITNAFPVKWQIPFLAAVTTLFTSALSLAFKSSEVRLAILGVTTTLFGIGVAQIVDNKEIERFTAMIADMLRKGFNLGMKGLFGEGIFGDKGPGGVLAIIAKLALLFKSGRELALDMAKSVITSPTKAAVGLVDTGRLKYGEAKLKETEKALQETPKRITDALTVAQKNFQKAERDLNNFRNNGAILSSNSSQTLAQLRATQATAQRALNSATNEFNQLPKTIDKLTSARNNLQKSVEGLSKKIGEQKEAFRSGLVNTGAAAGGAIATVYGYNLGTQIADSMVGYSGWAKVGVTIATALVAQGIGAFIGGAIVQGILATIGLVVTALTTPLIGGLALGAAAIYGIFQAVKNWDWWRDQIDELKGVARSWLETLGIGVNSKEKSVKEFDIREMNKQLKFLTEKLNNEKDLEIRKSLQEEIQRLNITNEANRKELKNLGGNAGYRSVDYSQDPFIRGQLNAAQKSVSDEDRQRNLEAYNKLRDFFSELPEHLKKAGKAISDFFISSANAAEQKTSFNPKDLSEYARMKATSAGLDPDIINRLFKQESGYNPLAVSRTGNMGIGQLSEGAMKDVGMNPSNVWNPFANIDGSVKYLKLKLEEFGGSLDKALAAYNWGSGNVKSHLKENQGELSPAKLPEETRNYLNVILGGLKDFKEKASDKISNVSKSTQEMIEESGFSVKSFMEFINKGPSLKEVGDYLLFKIGAKTKESTTGNSLIKDDTNTISEDISNILSNPSIPTIDLTKPKGLTEALGNQFTDKASITAINDYLEKINEIPLTIDDFTKVDPDKLQQLIVSIDNIVIAIDTINNETLPAATRAFAKGAGSRARAIIRDLTKEINFKDVGKKQEGPSQLAMQYGTEFLKTIQDSFVSGMASFLSGKMSGKDFMKSALDLFTSNILQGFSKGLIDSLAKNFKIGEKSIGDWISSIGAGVFSLGENSALGMSNAVSGTTPIVTAVSATTTAVTTGSAAIVAAIQSAKIPTDGFDVPNTGGRTDATGASIPGAANNPDEMVGQTESIFSKIGSTISKTFNNLLSSITDIMGSIGDVIGGMMDGLMDMLGNIDFSSIFSLFGFSKGGLIRFANGGLISGPGNGVSDSIAAMVSNGEYVVKASQTAKYLPLLEAINNNKLPKFASGGLVGDVSSQKSTVRDNKPIQQNFNFHITGDISRQTKSEINKLIPQIAQGIGSYNRERGIR